MLVHQNWSTKKTFYEGLVGFASIGNTYRIDDYLRVHAAGVTLRSLKEKTHYITNTLQMDVVKDQDGDLVVEASLLPKLAKSKYKRGSQEAVTKVTSGSEKSSAMPELVPELFHDRLQSSAKSSGLNT